MYFSDEIILIATDSSDTDALGRQTETETGRVTVYGDIKSVSREESFTAGSHGYSNVQKFVLRPWDYSGEKYPKAGTFDKGNCRKQRQTCSTYPSERTVQ